jgi:hypothetical protein
MPQAALSSQCTINDAARPELLKSPGISGHPNLKLGGSAQDTPRASGCPPKTQLLAV